MDRWIRIVDIAVDQVELLRTSCVKNNHIDDPCLYFVSWVLIMQLPQYARAVSEKRQTD